VESPDQPDATILTQKRRQHHVWQHYLKSWITAGRLFCLQQGRVFPTGTTTIAVEKHFYRLPELVAQDYRLIDLIVLRGAGVTKKLHENFLGAILGPIRYFEKYRQTAHDKEAVEKVLSFLRTNSLENYHNHIENEFLPLLDRVLADDISFFHGGPEDCLPFFMFMCVQMMRTKGVKVRVVEILRAKNGLDASRIWDLLAVMLATNSCGHLYRERHKRQLALVHNETGKEFITGDQPVINLLNHHKPDEQLSMYYPVSPALALVLSEVNQVPLFSTETLTVEHVAELNRRVFEASHAQVFARSARSLLPFATSAPS
jgi:hypothetical protein